MFRAQVLIVRRPKLYYTVSGIITPIGVMIPVYTILYSLYYTVSGIITPIGVMIPETVWYNFDLLTMSTCARNM